MWENGPLPPALTGFPGYLLARLGDMSRRKFQQALEPEGLHPRQFGVMTIVASQPGLTQQRLHEQTSIDPSSIVQVIDELEGMGLAERRPHPADRRARAIYLTDAGSQKLMRAGKLAGELQKELFAPLSDEQRRQLHELLLQLAGGAPEK
jgi:DNA-binding MarR family transcriptional regulator